MGSLIQLTDLVQVVIRADLAGIFTVDDQDLQTKGLLKDWADRHFTGLFPVLLSRARENYPAAARLHFNKREGAEGTGSLVQFDSNHHAPSTDDRR